MTRAVVLPVLMLLGLVACDKVPLTAPTDSEIRLSVSQTSVAIGGSIQVTASVIEAGGTAVHDGTTVVFTGGLGTFNPQEAQTVGGIARTIFTGVTSGTVKIGAFSGGAKVEPEIDVFVGSAAAETVSVRTDPATVPQSGGTVTVIASVRDKAGSPLPNAQVNFTADNGQLSANAAPSDPNGEARVTLVTNRTTIVGANVAGKAAPNFTLTALAAPSVTVGSCTPNPVVGVAVTCTVTPAVNATAGSPIQSVTVNWGDGTGDIGLGTITSATTASHTYGRADVYTVTAVATDTAGQVGRGTASLSVTRQIPSILITGPATGTVGTAVNFTVTPPSSSTLPAANVTVDFGDGTTRNLGAPTAATTVSKVYGSAGNYTVSATVTDTAGTRNTASTSIVISGSTGPGVQLAQPGTISGGCGSFTLTLTPAGGTTIASGSVKLERTGGDLYTGTTSSSFAACSLVVNDILTARYTDSTGATASAQVLVK